MNAIDYDVKLMNMSNRELIAEGFAVSVTLRQNPKDEGLKMMMELLESEQNNRGIY